MHSCVPVVVLLIFFKFNNFANAWCNATSNQKDYMCVGQRYYGFGSLGVSKDTRQQIETATFLECQQAEIPEAALDFPSIKNLKISCDVETIHENAFKNSRGLKELDLRNNRIGALPGGVFKFLGSLSHLYLSNNKLLELPRTLFEGLVNLKVLGLSKNLISEFDIKSLDHVKAIEELYLDSNEIEVIPSRVFSRLGALTLIDVSHNKMEDLGRMFTFTYGLKFANLSHNRIEEIPLQTFKLTKLEILDVSYNLLTVIHEDALKLDTLKELHLQHNKITLFEVKGVGLTRIPIANLDLRYNMLVYLEDNFVKIANRLHLFQVEGNPWDCACFEQMERLHGALQLDLSASYVNGEEPLCVVGKNRNVCEISKDDLNYYYEVFENQIGPRFI